MNYLNGQIFSKFFATKRCIFSADRSWISVVQEFSCDLELWSLLIVSESEVISRKFQLSLFQTQVWSEWVSMFAKVLELIVLCAAKLKKIGDKCGIRSSVPRADCEAITWLFDRLWVDSWNYVGLKFMAAKIEDIWHWNNLKLSDLLLHLLIKPLLF